MNDDDLDYDYPGSGDDPGGLTDSDLAAEAAAIAALKKEDQQRADDLVRADQDRADDERRQDDIRAEDQRREDELQALLAAEEQAQAQLEGDALEFGTDESVDERREAMEELLEKGRAQNTERAQQREAEAAQADQAQDKGGYYARGYQDIHGNYRSAAEVDAIMRNSKSHTDRQAYLAANGLDTSAGTKARQAELGKTAAESHAQASTGTDPHEGLDSTSRAHLQALERVESQEEQGGAAQETNWAQSMALNNNDLNTHLQAMRRSEVEAAVEDVESFSQGQASVHMTDDELQSLADTVERVNSQHASEESPDVDWEAELRRTDAEQEALEQQRQRERSEEQGGMALTR